MLKTYTINLGRFGEFEGSDFKELVLKIQETESPFVYKMHLLSTEDNHLQEAKATYIPNSTSKTNHTVTFGPALN